MNNFTNYKHKKCLVEISQNAIQSSSVDVRDLYSVHRSVKNNTLSRSDRITLEKQFSLQKNNITNSIIISYIFSSIKLVGQFT